MFAEQTRRCRHALGRSQDLESRSQRNIDSARVEDRVGVSCLTGGAYLFRASAALQALGVLGHLSFTNVDDSELRNRLTMNIGERNVDWRRTNWQNWSVMGRVDEQTHEVSPTSTRQVIEATIQMVRNKSGVEEYLATRSA